MTLRSPAILFIIRKNYDRVLSREISLVLENSTCALSRNQVQTIQDSALLIDGLTEQQRDRCQATEWVFERQRMADVSELEVASIKTCAQAIVQQHFPILDDSDLPWTLHAFTPDLEGTKPLKARVKNVEKALLQKLKSRFGRMYRRFVPCQELNAGEDHWIVQLFMDAPDHLYISVNRASPFIHPYPGGEQRMRFDSRSPSRSYLKLAEAMRGFPAPPAAGETAVDLGAAPGGWSCFLLKQGCVVRAVDHGPMKIKRVDDLPGTLEVVRSDGFRFQPGPEAGSCDWMCCDMLCAPRQTLELLQRWIENDWAKNYVVNFKLPQKNPAEFILEVRETLQDGRWSHLKIKQLYHDRDEVTLMGRRTI